MVSASHETNGSMPKPQDTVRLYGNRAAYTFQAARSIIKESPVCHIAFVHPGDVDKGGKREETIMNVPMISVVLPDPDIEEEDVEEDNETHHVVYLHSHRQSGLVEAIESGIKTLTASTIKIDGMVLSPYSHDHSLNYRSATFHLHSPLVLPDHDDPQAHEEKRKALAEVVNVVSSYDRSSVVGEPTDPNVTRTTVIRCEIRSVSCKQRYGGFNGGKEPREDMPQGEGKEGDAFTGVIPCWTTWGKAIGYGTDAEEVEREFTRRTEEGKAFAEGSAWAVESSTLEGLGKRRK